MAYRQALVSSRFALLAGVAFMLACTSRNSPSATLSNSAGSAGAAGTSAAIRDTSSLVAPVQTPWVPHSDDPTCQHVAVVKNCADSWCRIPAGCFVAGSPEDEAGRGMYTEDLATVYLTRGFEIGQFEITRADWAKTGWQLPVDEMPIRGMDVCNASDCPMTRVSWFAAMLYANWLSVNASPSLAPCYSLKNCGSGPEYAQTCESVSVNAATVYDCEGYRLPTEIEWEYAARAGARTPFFAAAMSPAVAQDIENCVKEPALEDWAWYCANTPDNRTQPVGRKGANAWGLHDVSGNAIEFVSNPQYTRTKTATVIDPWGDVDATLQIAPRGGEFSGLPDYLRLASRFDWRKEGDAITGFRLVRTLSK